MMRAALVVFVFALAIVVGIAAGTRAAQVPSSFVVVQPAQGYAPPSIVIQANTPSEVQLCAGTAGLVSCRSVSDFRAWVQTRK